MTDERITYSTSAAFRRAVGDRIKQAARERGRPVLELRREFLFQQFLARLFVDPDSPWVLKGGAGLLIRLPGARYSRDIDLLYSSELNVREALTELQSMAGSARGDHLTFVVDDPVFHDSDQALATVGVTGYTGATRFDRFPIDLSTREHVVARPERLRPEPIVDIPGLPPLPEFTLYPLPDQVADKICAMYAAYGSRGTPSTRYRDLVDLVLIITTSSLEAEATARALRLEAQRRSMVLPASLRMPGAQWRSGYAAIARDSTLAAEYRSIDDALTLAGRCIDPLLATERIHNGRWNPHTLAWER